MMNELKKLALIVLFSLFSTSLVVANAPSWSNFGVSFAKRCKNQMGSVIVSSLVGGLMGSVAGAVDGVLYNFAPFNWCITWPLESTLREELMQVVEEELAANDISHNKNTMRTAGIIASWVAWIIAVRSVFGPYCSRVVVVYK